MSKVSLWGNKKMITNSSTGTKKTTRGTGAAKKAQMLI